MTLSPPALAPVEARRRQKERGEAVAPPPVLVQVGGLPAGPAGAVGPGHHDVLPVVPDLLVAAVLSQHQLRAVPHTGLLLPPSPDASRGSSTLGA